MIENIIQNEKYKGLSKDEIYFISRIEYEKKIVITTQLALNIFKEYDNNYKKAVNVLSNLTKKKRLIQIERGKYVLVPIKAPFQQWSFNEFLIA